MEQYQAPQSQVGQAGGEEFSTPRIFAVSGRIGRLRYLAYSVGMLMVWFIIFGLAVAVMSAAVPALVLPVVFLSYLFLLIYSFMIAIQRCHDFNTTGWLSLILLIPVASLIFLFIPGTDGPNDYGNKPKPNHAGIIILCLMLPVLGILAAIAIPAYQGYVQQSQQYQLEQSQ